MDLLRRPSAFLPVVLSLAALGVIAARIAAVGVAAEPDEGLAAHVWRLLMVVQVPLMLYFAVTWVPREPRRGVPVLAIQLVAALAAMAPVLILRW